MSIDVGAVTGAMRHLLRQVVMAADELGHPIPDRRYVTTGGAVYDCAQVTVSAGNITTGIAASPDAGGPLGPCPPGWAVTLELAIVRGADESMVTTSRAAQVAPAVTDIEADTARADADAAILTSAIETIAGPGWDQYGAVPASIQFGDVEGNLTAVVLSCTLNLWSIPIDLETGEHA